MGKKCVFVYRQDRRREKSSIVFNSIDYRTQISTAKTTKTSYQLTKVLSDFAKAKLKTRS